MPGRDMGIPSRLIYQHGKHVGAECCLFGSASYRYHSSGMASGQKASLHGAPGTMRGGKPASERTGEGSLHPV